MTLLKASLLYFALVFGAGFILGPIRILWLIPQVGERSAELMELPFMIAVSYLAARWIVRRFSIPSIRSIRIRVGLMALGLMLISEISLGLWIRGISLNEIFTSRDPVSGTAYYLALALFAALPLLISR